MISSVAYLFSVRLQSEVHMFYCCEPFFLQPRCPSRGRVPVPVLQARQGRLRDAVPHAHVLNESLVSAIKGQPMLVNSFTKQLSSCGLIYQ